MVWNMFKVRNKDTRAMSLASFWLLYCYLWTYFTPCSSVSIVNFEHVIAGWVYCILDLLENYNAFQSNFIEITLRQGCSPVNLLHIFRTPFHKNASGGLLLLKGIGDMIIVKLCNLAKTLKFHVHKNCGNQT